MKTVANVIWYDEHPDDLREMAESIAGFADAMVAVDGAFATFPRTEEMMPWSSSDQIQAISEGCATAGVELLAYQPKREGEWADALGPNEHFVGNEPDKRTASLKMSAVFRPDWVFNIDADMRLTRWDDEAKQMMADTQLDVALVDVEGYGPSRILFRWSPQLEYWRTHYVVRNNTHFLAYPKVVEAGNKQQTLVSVTDHTQIGWMPIADPLNLTEHVWFDHPPKKDSWRRVRQDVWYVTRDEMGLEKLN